MGGRYCCVQSCRRRSHDHRGWKIPNELTFHCFPAWRMNEGAGISELTRRRRAAWVAAVRHSNITFDHIPSSMRVCSRHFLSGKPAYEMLESDPDWVPSLHLGHGVRRSKAASPAATDRNTRWPTDTRHKEVDVGKDDVVSLGRDLQLQEPDVVTCVPGTQIRSGEKCSIRHKGTERQAGREAGRQAGRQACQVLPPWREARALLSALPGKTTVSDQDRCPTEARTRIDFMDFFRDTLEASLEASSRSTALSQRQRRTCGCSSPPGVNYVKMQKRIEELEEQLLYLTGREQDALTSPVPNVAAVKPNQDLRLPGPAPKEEEEEESEWMKPLSPSQDDLHDNDEDADLAKDISSPQPVRFHAPPSEPRRPHRRFIKSWLCMFSFLRYSPTRDLMWCHVCRLYADKQFQKLGLIKGSRVFKMQNIRKHSESRYHNDSLHIYELHTRGGAATSVVGF